MRRALLPLLALAVLPACDGILANGETRPVRLTNGTDRPVAAFVVSASELPYIDPQPALRAELFDGRRVDVGATVQMEDMPNYNRGDDVAVFLYVQTDSIPARVEQTYGPRAASLVALKRVSAAELRQAGYTVVVRDLRP